MKTRMIENWMGICPRHCKDAFRPKIRVCGERLFSERLRSYLIDRFKSRKLSIFELLSHYSDKEGTSNHVEPA